MSRQLWIDKRGEPVITSTPNGEQNAKRWGWSKAVAVTPADRPSVTDDARAEAERHYPALNADDEALTYPRSAVREHARGGFVAGAEWAAGRAETTTEWTEADQ